MAWRTRQNDARRARLSGRDGASAPSWKQAAADELLHTINIGTGAAEAGPAPVARAELTVRQILASEAAAAESAAAARKLVALTWAIVVLTTALLALTGVLVWLTT